MMIPPQVGLGVGFSGRVLTETKTKTSVIGGEKIKEKQGKLSKDLGEPAMGATEAELQSYVDNAPNSAEKKKRVARVNLMKAHKKGHKAQGHKLKESIVKPMASNAVVKPKFR